jgi:hypothetical protein
MRALLMASVVAGMTFAAAAAQAAPANRQAVKVPFSFVVNGQQLPAGTYTVQRDGDLAAGTLLLRSDKAAAYVFTAPNASEQSADASLVFAKENGRYRLAQILDAGSAQDVLDAR